jgi:hypothetical protein
MHHSLNLYGVCADCQAKTQHENDQKEKQLNTNG